jgi:hypothetical protein
MVTRDETFAVIDRQAAEGAWSYRVLYDARAGTNAPTEEDIRRMVLHVGGLTTRHGPRGPVALVVSDPHLVMMGGWYACLGELAALRFAVFKTVEEAEDWLETQA